MHIMQDSEKIIFIEMYYKISKSNHDEERIKKYFGDI